MYLGAASHGEVMALGNHLKEEEHWKGKYGPVSYERNQLQEKLASFQKDMETYDAPFGLASQVIALKASLDEKEKAVEDAKTSLTNSKAV